MVAPFSAYIIAGGIRLTDMIINGMEVISPAEAQNQFGYGLPLNVMKWKKVAKHSFLPFRPRSRFGINFSRNPVLSNGSGWSGVRLSPK